MQPISKPHIKQIFNDSLDFVRVNLRQMASLCLPILLIVTLLGFGLAQSYRSSLNAFFMPFVFNLLVYPLYTGALIQLMFRKARHENPSNGELMIAASRMWAPFFLLKTTMVVLIFIGSMLIVPGIWMWIRFSFAECYLVVFGLKPKEALQKSLIATKPYFGLLFLLLVTTYLPVVAINFFVDKLIWTLTQSIWLSIVANTLCSFLGLFVLVIIFRVFMEVMQNENER